MYLVYAAACLIELNKLQSTFSGSDKSSQRNVYYWETNELDYENPPPSPRRALDQYLYVSGDKTDMADKCANSPNPG